MFAFLYSDKLNPLYSIILAFPTVLFTIFLVVCCFYWLSVFLGLVDLDVIDIDGPEVDTSGSFQGAGALSGLMLKFDLYGIPLTIVISILVLVGWLLSSFFVYLFFPLIPDGIFEFIAGAIALLIILYVSAWLTGKLLNPFKSFFRSLDNTGDVNLIGRTVTVRTNKISHSAGEGILDDGAAGLLIKIRSYEGTTFARNEKVVILENIDNSGIYRVVSEQEFNR